MWRKGVAGALTAGEYFGGEARTLADAIGRDRVIWRFDPLMLAYDLTIDDLMERVFRLGRKVEGYARKLVFSFADIEKYRKLIKELGIRR